MDAFIRYMSRKKPTQFFFIENMGVVRFSVRTDIVNLKTGELLDTLKVRHLSQVIYCERYSTLFLKSAMGPVYSYRLETKELRKIGNTGNNTYAMFLDQNQSFLIVFSDIGECWKIETDTLIKSDFYHSGESGFYRYAWDNPKEKCYCLLSDSAEQGPKITKLSYDGARIERQAFAVDHKEVSIHYFEYISQKELFVLQYSHASSIDHNGDIWDKLAKVHSFHDINTILDGVHSDFGSLDIILALGYGNLDIQTPLLHEIYEGGVPCSCAFECYLFVSFGNKTIYMIDLRTNKIVRIFHTDTTIGHIQYDPCRNILFIADYGMTMIHDVI